MTVGDVVNAIGGLTSTWYYFQPAISIECAITSMTGAGVNVKCGVYNGTLNSFAGCDTSTLNPFVNMKVMINNSIYFSYYADGIVPSFTGIQIK